MHVPEAIVDQERVFGQVQEVPLADADVRDARTGRCGGVERAGLIEHRTGVAQGADALRGAGSELGLDEHEAAALLRLRLPWRQHGRRPAAGKVFQGIGREEPAVGALKFGDQRQLFLRRLHGILRMIVDRAERLIGQSSGAKVVHERRIQRRRVDGAGDAAKQHDTGRRRILRDPDVGRQWTTMRMVACSAMRDVPLRQKAKEHFRRAIELDPSYALAYSGLADSYTFLGSDGFMPMREAYPLGKAAALKALELDDMLGEAHNSLAGIPVDYYFDWIEGGRHFARAIELNPNYEPALRSYSFYLANMGRHGEALAFAERARDLDPVSPSAWHSLGLVHYFARRYDEAIAQFRETLDLDPNFGAAHIMLGRVYVAKGMPDRAVEELERAQRLLGARPDVMTPTPTPWRGPDAGARRL